MSSNALFDEDSSDEEEQAKPSPKKRVIDEDDDDDDDDEMKEAAPKRTIELDEDDDDDDDEAPKKTSKRGESKKVEYSPDEEDAEFDEEGGIIGSAAPVQPPADTPSKKRQKKMTVLESKLPPKDTTLHITKLPNLVGIQPEPFDVDTFKPEDEEAEYDGHVHNMVRWRYKKDGNGNFIRKDGKLQRESNARIVKWDDGSMTMHIGSEIFVCDQLDSKPTYPGLNGYLYLSQKATFPTEDGNDDDEQPGGTVLECMGPISSKLTARPSSLQSAAHKALTVAVRQKTTKRATIAEYVTQEDPEKLKEERIRHKTDLDKAQARKNTSRNYGGGSNKRAPGMNRRYMEEDDGNYDSVNIKDLKRRQMTEDDDMMDYGDDDSDEDDDDEDVGWSKGKLAAMRNKKRQQEEVEDDDDDEEEEFGVGGDSDEEEQVARKKPKKAQANLFDDDDD